MNIELSEIWQKALNLIKTELTEVSYNTWLKPIEPIALNQNTLTLAVANDFSKGILEARYANLIRNAIKQITSEEYKLEFTIPGSEDYLKASQSFERKSYEKKRTI